MRFKKRSPWRSDPRLMPPGPEREHWIKQQRRRGAKVANVWSQLARVKRFGDTQKIIRVAKECTGFCDSEQRLERLIYAVADQPATVFWPVWLFDWPTVDYSAEFHELLPSLFKTKGSALPYMKNEAKARFDALPDTVIVYRGCSSLWIKGVSWTTKRTVAEYFATGGRYGRPIAPVVVTGRINKRSADFYYCSGDSLGEAEIVCSPSIIKFELYTKLASM